MTDEKRVDAVARPAEKPKRRTFMVFLDETDYQTLEEMRADAINPCRWFRTRLDEWRRAREK